MAKHNETPSETLSRLRAEHKDLERSIAILQKRPSFHQEEVTRLKRQKLQIKRRIVKLEESEGQSSKKDFPSVSSVNSRKFEEDRGGGADITKNAA